MPRSSCRSSRTSRTGPAVAQTVAREAAGSGHAGVLITDAPEEVLDDLEAALTADGWDEASRTDLNGELLALAPQREDDMLDISMGVDGDETMLTVMLIESG
jgi:hypothetical protein